MVGIAVLGGVATGAYHGARAAAAYVESFPSEAHAATTGPQATVEPIEAPVIREVAPVVVAATASAPIAVAEPAPAPDAAPGSWGTVFPAPDEVLLAPLRDGALAAAALNRAGSSLTMRLDLASGARGAFKPEQTWWQSAKPRRDVAAYRIDRLLGIGHVAPAIGRAFPVAELVATFEPDKRRFWTNRVKTEGRPRPTGELAGSLSWWIPQVIPAKIDGYDVDSTDGVVTWRRLLRIGARIPEDDRALVEQISTMTLFDFVIDNIDRWSGGNVRVAPGGRDVYFMDNTMSFTNDVHGHRKGQRYLERVHVFSRRLVTRLRALTEAELRAALVPDGGAFELLLTDSEIRAVLGRRDAALAHIDRLIARHGEDAVLAFP
jgi:hypothetical protein